MAGDTVRVRNRLNISGIKCPVCGTWNPWEHVDTEYAVGRSTELYRCYVTGCPGRLVDVMEFPRLVWASRDGRWGVFDDGNRVRAETCNPNPNRVEYTLRDGEVVGSDEWFPVPREVDDAAEAILRDRGRKVPPKATFRVLETTDGMRYDWGTMMLSRRGRWRR